MTVCIAALAEDRRSLVLVADRMISTATSQTELAISKMQRVRRNWWALFAGTDLTAVFPILDTLTEQFPEMEKWDKGVSITNVEQLLRIAFESEREKRAESVHLSPYSMTMKTFTEQGRAQLGDSLFERLLTGISYQRLPCELLLAGFIDGMGYVLSVADPGLVSRFDIPGFHAIGSGAPNALSMLYFRAQDYTDPLPKVLYQSYEAKIYGSLAPGVGQWTTDIKIVHPDMNERDLDEDEIESMEDIWGKHSRPGMPDEDDLAELMKPFLSEPHNDESDSETQERGPEGQSRT